ncbi:MAG: ribosome biogenesis GTPase YlqF [Acholeplasma sp.]|nr:ribosome biogenesis GTPase YlqF [Acholeplasma sp.]
MEKNNRYQQINWYPGHMFKSFKEIKANLSLVDLVFLLIDARIPYSSMNPEILKVLKDKKTIIVFNKSDLADTNVSNEWIKHYEEQGFICSMSNAQSGIGLKELNKITNEMFKEINERNALKGLKPRNLKVMVLGIPNVGKSTLINSLTNRKSAKTGNRPGVTKSKQWIKMDNGYDLLDMPGVLWPKFKDQKVGYHLAITGAIKDDILPLDDITNYAINLLQKHYLGRLKNRYDNDITSDMSFVEILDIIGKKRGALLPRGEIDYDRVYMIILNDIRSLQLGRLSFDFYDEKI